MALPPALRLTLVAVIGAWVGTLAHRWAARLRAQEVFSQRLVRRDDAAQARFDWPAWVPILGWWLGRGSVEASSLPRSRRHRSQDAIARSWRPLVVELSSALAFAGLYWWEVLRHGLVEPPMFPSVAAQIAPGVLHAPLVLHLILFGLMLAASLIDLDEKIIPDEITVMGTLLGLLLLYLLPSGALPSVDWLRGGQAVLTPIHAASPNNWPAEFLGRPQFNSFLLGVGCFGLWCFALLPRSWRTRRGWRIAWALCWRGIRRERFSAAVASMFVLGSSAIGFAWMAGGVRWQSLLSALLGMVASGGIVWCVRVIGHATLGREAMGFGDVTLLAMIGAFLGWQAGWMIFFVAPFFGLAFGIFQAMSSREWEIPYGPFLCLGTLVVIVRWSVLWEGTREIFAIGWLLPCTLGVMLLLMAGMLAVWARIKRRWLPERH